MLLGCYFEISWLVWCHVSCERMYMWFWTGVGDCCRKTVARPDNLAQVSQSHLGEMDRDLARPLFTRQVAQATRSIFERANVSPKREGSRLSEIPCELLRPFSSPRLGEGGSPEREPLAWARPFSLSEELGETVGLCGCFWNSKMVYACLDVDYCVKCMRQINMHEWCDSWIVNDGFGREPSHMKWMRWLVLIWHDIDMRWNCTMLVEDDELVWITGKMKGMDYKELVRVRA